MDLAGSALHARFGPETPLRPERLVGLVRSIPGASLSPQGVLRVPVGPGTRPVTAVAELLAGLSQVEAAIAE